MSWKTVVVTTKQKISVKNNQCLLTNIENDQKISFSFDDLNCILLENNYILLSVQLLTKLAENNILLLTCDLSHDPVGIFLPFNKHWKPLEIFNIQIKQALNQKQIIWTKIIEQKIANSLNVLINLNSSERSIEMVENFLNSITLNDTTNREGLTAKVFFRELYGSSFIRFSDDAINNALNYGYKILASCISRTIVKYGLHCHLGVFHKGKTNNWNLSYDFIEPFRPMIDYWVARNIESLGTEGLNYNTRINLVKLLNENVVIDSKVNTVINAIDIMIKSYVTVLKTEDFSKLKLPILIFENFEKSEVEYEKEG
jgi:CRISPR-associated protein Cas1